MKLEPNYNLVVVKPDNEGESKSSGGILIAANAQRPVRFGTVLAVSDRIESGVVVKVRLHVNDRIVYKRDAGVPVKLDTEEVVVVHINDVLGLITAA